MITSKHFVFALALSSIFACFSGVARAQQLNCVNIKDIVKIVAEDSTLHSITGPEIKSKSAGIKKYMALRIFWDKETDKMEDQYIQYDKESHSYSYQALTLTEGTSGKEEVKETEQFFKSCLGNPWFLKATANSSGDSVYYLKNPATHVVIKISGAIGAVLIECNNDSKKGNECVTGDCDSYFGTRHVFSEDIYTGTFLDGSLTGIGKVSWYSLKMGYEGSFIGNQIAGYGTMYYGDKVLHAGIYFMGDPATVDTAKYTCQYGNCNTGFGLKVIKGGFYVGNFKDSLYNGLGELVMNKTFFYGYFEKNQINGKGIYINAAGEYVFATYAKGRAIGNYEKDYADKTSREANVDGRGSMFDGDNFLIEAGVWGKAGFTQYTDAAYLDSKSFAKSLKDFYAYRKTRYKEIRGIQDKGLQSLGIEFYKSKLLFMNTLETNISADRYYNYFVTVNLSGKSADKLKGVDTYNKYYNNLSRAVGSRWRTSKDDGLASAQKSKASVVLENIFDASKSISLSLDRGSVSMEIH